MSRGKICKQEFMFRDDEFFRKGFGNFVINPKYL